MKAKSLAGALLFVGLASPALALSPEEIIKLKQAGVSELTIQKMLEQERLGQTETGPVIHQKDQVVYQAGEGARSEAQKNREHELYKEKKSLEMIPGVIVDQRGDTSK